jgi:hypothetical protein
VTVGRDFLIDYAGSQGASPKSGEIAEIIKRVAFSPGIDAQDFHGNSLGVWAQ